MKAVYSVLEQSLLRQKLSSVCGTKCFGAVEVVSGPKWKGVGWHDDDGRFPLRFSSTWFSLILSLPHHPPTLQFS